MLAGAAIKMLAGAAIKMLTVSEAKKFRTTPFRLDLHVKKTGNSR